MDTTCRTQTRCICFSMQPAPEPDQVFTDSLYAGCSKTPSRQLRNAQYTVVSGPRIAAASPSNASSRVGKEAQCKRYRTADDMSAVREYQTATRKQSCCRVPAKLNFRHQLVPPRLCRRGHQNDEGVCMGTSPCVIHKIFLRISLPDTVIVLALP
jgi:hypothetical protein